MKKQTLLITALCLLLLLCSCSAGGGPDKDATLAENSYVRFDLEDTVEHSTCAVVGIYRGFTHHSEYKHYHYAFDVDAVLYGSVPQSQIKVYALTNGTVADMEGKYETGEKYVLILKETLDSAYGGETTYMSPSSEDMFPLSGPYTMYGDAVTIPAGESFGEYICRLKGGNSAAGAYIIEQDSAEYADIPNAIAGESDFIGYVTVEELSFVGAGHTDSFVCTVTELIKGEGLNTRDDGTILLALRKGAAEEGESYLIGFDRVGEDSVIYSQAISESVISSVNTAEIEAVLDAVS